MLSSLEGETEREELKNKEENKVGKSRVEIIGGKLFTRDSHTKLSQIA